MECFIISNTLNMRILDVNLKTKHSIIQDKKFLEEISSLFTDSAKSSRMIIDQLRQISLPSVRQDIRTVYPRSTIIKLLVLFKLMAIPNINKLKILKVGVLLPFGRMYCIKYGIHRELIGGN